MRVLVRRSFAVFVVWIAVALRLSGLAEAQGPRTLAGHTDVVHSVAFSPDGRTIASGSADKTIRLWDAVSGRALHSLIGHAGSVLSVAFSPDGQTIASGSADNTIKLWDAASGRELRTLKGHISSVGSVAFSPDGRTIASGSWDNTIKLWDVATGQRLRSLAGHASSVESAAFSPDGRTIASGSWDNTVELWDAASGQKLRALNGHKAFVYSVAFSPDGRMIASGSADKTIRLWDTASGRELRKLEGHSDRVLSVAFSHDGRTIASASADNAIKLWDAATGRELRTLKGHLKSVDSVAFSPNGRTIASGSGDNAIKLWDVADLVADASSPPSPAPQIAAATPALLAAPGLPHGTDNASPPATAVPQSPAPKPTAARIPPVLGRRVALVIGNADYQNAPLANPTFDADLVTAGLKKIGFEVTEVKNADFAALDAALTDFIAKEDRPDVVLLYFAGHGFAMSDGLRPRNYLMTTSADLSSTSEVVLRRDGMPLDEVIDRIPAPARITLAFVDACRNDPFHRGAGDRGFQPLDIPLHRQLYIGMSTQLGKTAIDGVVGMGSPFAQSFVEVMATPGLRIDDAFRELRAEVAQKTQGQQRPEILQDDLERGAFVLVGPQASGASP